MTAMSNTRKFAALMIAVVATVAVHGGWLKAMDRDAIAVTAVATGTAHA
jgi:hypothetical protein